MWLSGIVVIRSEKSIEEVGKILSEHLLGGLPFYYREDAPHDEEDVFSPKHRVLGMDFKLTGEPLPREYLLRFQSSLELFEPEKTIYISEYITQVLAKAPGLEASLWVPPPVDLSELFGSEGSSSSGS